MTTIRSLVTLDEHAEFRNDVQISDYENKERNLSLLKSYLFTSTATPGQDSSSEVLRTIISSYMTPQVKKNRIVVIANYGHGKSHLALVLANYFGKPIDSPENKVIFSKLEQAVKEPARVQAIRVFRESHAPFLIVRLRGDQAKSLREQFFSDLEQALKEHEATKDVILPFWYQKAESLLNDLSGETLAKANQYLEPYRKEVSQLLQDVKDRKDAAYDLCRSLFGYLHGVIPDLGGEVSQHDAINWVASTYCGEGKPFGGIFVLFDEFSLYIQQYAQRNAAGELQDLLNGIEDQYGKAVFVSFAQHDPKVVAQNAIRNDESRESLEKELSRIDKKVILYSLMESVINSYLTQPQKEWQAFRADRVVVGPALARAANITMDLFAKRYERTLRWEVDEFDEIVTKGCFPLHPLTTALLCDLQLQAIGSAGSPRTVLGFVFEQVQEKANEPVIENGLINWLLPVYLVDYFNEYLSENSLILYNNARRALPPDAPDEHVNLIKALLLQEMAKLPVRRDTQVTYLAEASGLKESETSQLLRKLSDARVIRYDSYTRLYTFWPVAANPHRMEELIRQRLQGRRLSWESLSKLNEGFPPIPIDIDWGNMNDWEASEYILPLEYFTPQRLRELVPQFSVGTNGLLTEGRRGCLIWLVGQNDEEVLVLKQNATKVLDEAFPGENPPAIVLILRNQPNPTLIETHFKNQIIAEFSQDDRTEVGNEVYELEKGRQKLALSNEINLVRGDSVTYRTKIRPYTHYVVPNAYRPAIQALGDLSIPQFFKELYKLVYRFSPPKFFTQYRVTGTANLNRAVKSVADVLFRNSLSSRDSIFSQPVAKDLCEKFLRQEWQVLTPDYRVQEPGTKRLAEAWNLLERDFPEGVSEKRARKSLIDLVNPPYGFDYNTSILILCTWIGYHSHGLQLSNSARLINQKDFQDIIANANNAKVIFQQLVSGQNIAITRSDPGQITKEVQEINARVNNGSFTQKEAKDAITKLEEFCREQSPELPLCTTAQQSIQSLKSGLELAEQYDKESGEINTSILGDRNIDVILPIQKRIGALKKSTLVKETGPQASELHDLWIKRVTSMVEQQCSQLENIERLTQVEAKQEKLNRLKKQLKELSLDQLISRVEQALNAISTKEEELAKQEQEAPLQAEIKGMNTTAPLKSLYEYRERLSQIKGYSDATMALRDEKSRKIAQEISQLEQVAEASIEALDEIDAITSIDEWQRTLLRSIDRFVDTPFQSKLEKAERKGKVIQKFLQQINDLSKRNPLTPEEAKAIRIEMGDLRKLSQNGLTSKQHSLIDTAIQNLDAQAQGLVEEAKKWFADIDTQYKRGDDVYDVRDCIKEPPSFLPFDERTHLEQMKVEVDQKIEQDIVGQIVERFNKIKDSEIKAQCVQKLQQILEDEKSAQSN